MTIVAAGAVGQSVTRPDAIGKVTGAADYPGDLRPGAVLRDIVDAFRQHDLLTYSAAIAFQILVALEAVYLWWLPAERPVRPTRRLPAFVRSAIWADLGGKGRVTPQR